MKHPRILLAAIAGAILATVAFAALAASPEVVAGNIMVRSDSRPTLGRIVIDTKSKPELNQNGDVVSVRLPEGVVLGPPPPLPRNVVAIRTDGSVMELTLKPGTSVRETLAGGRVVFEVADAPGDRATPPKGPKGASPDVKPPAPPSRTMQFSPELGGRSAAVSAKPALPLPDHPPAEVKPPAPPPVAQAAPT